MSLVLLTFSGGGGCAVPHAAVTVVVMLAVSIPFTTKVVGISQYQGAALCAEVGDSIEVRHEPQNPFDANACVILHDGRVIGYVPKTIAARLVARNECAWRGIVVARHDAKATIGLEVRIERDFSDYANPIVSETPSAATASGRPINRMVAAKRSGRILGTLVRAEREHRRVIVATAAGEVPYPDGLVDIVELH